jgi:hypothetical protein
MATYTKVLLSGSTQGQPITVVATASTGTTINATGTSSSIIDEVWLYANNTSTSPVLLTVQFGGTGSVQHAKPITLAPQSGDVLIVAGLPLTGTGGSPASANTVAAFAATASVITISGYVNRIS